MAYRRVVRTRTGLGSDIGSTTITRYRAFSDTTTLTSRSGIFVSSVGTTGLVQHRSLFSKGCFSSFTRGFTSTTTRTTSHDSTAIDKMADTTPAPTTTTVAEQQQQQDGDEKWQRHRSQTHFNIVALETSMVPVPSPLLPPDSGRTYTLHTYSLTPHTDLAVAAERIRDADVVILSVHPMPRTLLDPKVSPRLKHIAVVASGTDQVDKEYCRERGIVVSNTPGANVVSVAEHVVAMYFATRRSLAVSSAWMRTGTWGVEGMAGKSSRVLNQGMGTPASGGGGGGGDDVPDNDNEKDVMMPPRTCESEVLGVIGYGGVGKKVAALARALGMKVLISGRKGASSSTESTAAAVDGPSPSSQPTQRTPFTTLLSQATVIVLSCPRSPETLDLLSTPEFALMRPDALVINVSRGGVVDEAALLSALQTRKIAGAASDVFLTEPATPDNSVLLGKEAEGLNLVATPHVAWYAEETVKAYNRALQDNLKGWLEDGGRPKYPVVWRGD